MTNQPLLKARHQLRRKKPREEVVDEHTGRIKLLRHALEVRQAVGIGALKFRGRPGDVGLAPFSPVRPRGLGSILNADNISKARLDFRYCQCFIIQQTRNNCRALGGFSSIVLAVQR